MLEAVIFDMDGVIVDTEPGYLAAVNRFLKRFGKSIDSKFNEQFFGGSAYDMWAVTKKHVGLDHLTVEECMKGMEEEREKMIRQEGYRAIPGTIPLIQDLYDRGIPLAVASSSSLSEIEKVTKYLNVRKYFAKIVSGIDECEHAKTVSGCFLKSSQKTGRQAGKLSCDRRLQQWGAGCEKSRHESHRIPESGMWKSGSGIS